MTTRWTLPGSEAGSAAERSVTVRHRSARSRTLLLSRSSLPGCDARSGECTRAQLARLRIGGLLHDSRNDLRGSRGHTRLDQFVHGAAHLGDIPDRVGLRAGLGNRLQEPDLAFGTPLA